MHTITTRRTFLAACGALAAASLVPMSRAMAAAPPGMKFGYTAMTWGNDERQAITDIAALGFQGIQFRDSAVKNFQPAELRTLLERNKLSFTALSSGIVALDADPKEEIARHVANARYLQQAGGLYLQVLDKLTVYPRSATPADCEQLGRLLTEIGKRTADLGITLAYHNHLNTLSETPEGTARIMAASDPRYVKFELDTAHALAGGGDPAAMIEAYRERLLFLHLKDVIDIPTAAKGKYPFQFVELGRGRVDFGAVFAALGKVNFQGWAVIELDRVPQAGMSPKDSAMISIAYLRDKFGVRLAGAQA